MFAERTTALEVRNLAVSFGGNKAVNDVSFAVAAGEIVGLIGPNGAGKTTVFDLISGFTSADAGHVLLHGHDVSRSTPPVRAKQGIGRSFQDARLFPGLTVSETMAVSLERWIDGDGVVSGGFRLPSSLLAERDIAHRVDELIELFGLQYFRSKRIAELSTGSRRMVDLACVVAQSPSVVMLDEPTSGIAQREAEALGPMLLGLRDRLDATLLVIEHDISLISSISDRLVALDQGSVVTVGGPSEVLDHPHVVASYLGTSSEVLQRSDYGSGPEADLQVTS
jgi:branched-chain amino acid transport system ATP-binding protein